LPIGLIPETILFTCSTKTTISAILANLVRLKAARSRNTIQMRPAENPKISDNTLYPKFPFSNDKTLPKDTK
jgi:hypothetical protein